VNLLYYAGTVIIWGTTWLAIKFQLGTVDPLVSIIYRFTLAAAMLQVYCRVARLKMRFTAGEHLFMALQGVLLFALNYWMFYVAEVTLTSGIVAVVFSTMVILNIFNGALLIGSPVRPQVLVGALFGLAGIGLVFWPELSSFSLSDRAVFGLGLSIAATCSASLGNITSARNQKSGLPVVQTNAWGMSYGALAMVAAALVTGKSFDFEVTGPYVVSLLYLTIFGSIVAFGFYLSLVGRIGADRAAYATLLFPLVALGMSTVFEGYNWTPQAFAGVTLILIGNVLALSKVGRGDVKPV